LETAPPTPLHRMEPPRKRADRQANRRRLLGRDPAERNAPPDWRTALHAGMRHRWRDALEQRHAHLRPPSSPWSPSGDSGSHESRRCPCPRWAFLPGARWTAAYRARCAHDVRWRMPGIGSASLRRRRSPNRARTMSLTDAVVAMARSAQRALAEERVRKCAYAVHVRRSIGDEIIFQIMRCGAAQPATQQWIADADPDRPERASSMGMNHTVCAAWSLGAAAAKVRRPAHQDIICHGRCPAHLPLRTCAPSHAQQIRSMASAQQDMIMRQDVSP